MNSMEFTQWLTWLMAFVTIVGLLGNMASFLVYSRPQMAKSSIGILLLVLSIVDFFLLILSTFIFILPRLEIWENQWKIGSLHTTFCAYVFKFVYPMAMMLKSCSLNVVVVITLERWVAVCQPLKAHVWCSRRNSVRAVVVIVVFAVLFNLIRFFEHKIEFIDGGAIHGRLLKDPVNHWWYYFWYYTVLNVIVGLLVPLFVMAFANGHVILVLYRANKQRKAMTAQEQKETRTTVMLLVVTITFAVCHVGTSVPRLCESIFKDFHSSKETRYFAAAMVQLSNFLVVLNFATTFFVYWAFSESFRNTFRSFDLFGRKRAAKKSTISSTGTKTFQLSSKTDL